MVQREGADRFFAEPSTKAYGAVSVLVQLASERTGFHPVSREVFRPRPNVDSALVAFRRTARGIEPAVKRLVEASFAHRRKTLANSLALSGLAPRERGVEALAAIGRAAGVRAEEARAGGVRRPRGCARMIGVPAPAKINLALVAGDTRPDGLHEVATILQRVELADTISLEGGGRGSASRSFPERHDRPAGARGGSRSGRGRARLASADREAHPGRGRARRRELGRGKRPQARGRPALAGRVAPDRLAEIAAGLGVDVPFFLEPGPKLGTGDGTTLVPLDLPQDYFVLLVLSHGDQKPSTAEIYRRFAGAAGFARRRELVLAIAAAGPEADLTALPPNDLAQSPLSAALRALGAFRADVSGAGPVVYGLFRHRDAVEAAAGEVAALGKTWLTRPAW